MVSFKILLAAMPLILSVTALPSPAAGIFARNAICFPPSNCGAPVGDCLWCCMVPPDELGCHQDGNVQCGFNNGGRFWHCEEHDDKKIKA